MHTVNLLDCTLRDGGYINNWEFGKDAIVDMTRKLEQTGVEILELGFLKDEPYDEKRSVFNDIDQVKQIIGKKKPGLKYAVMVEVVNPLPLEKLAPADEDGPDIIRVIVWKRMLKEGFEYCKGIVEKGYKICVQPARVSQYSDEEFIDMVKMFNQLNPLAIYVVDSWGTMYKEELLHYLQLADEHMKPGIAAGYHGHNNMMQAFDVACAFTEQKIERDLIIDASVYGIGRGAGNLNTELFAKYMNAKHARSYDLSPLVEVYDQYIAKIYKKCKWGYSVPFFITAKYNCNPDFASYYEEQGLSCAVMEKIISSMKPEERIIFKKDIAYNAMRAYWKNKLCLIVPTANRPKLIDKHIRQLSKTIMKFNVDLIIVDSSNNDKTKKIVESWQKAGITNLIYDFYDGPIDKMSIDTKVLSSYQKYAGKYEYVMASRDGLAVNLETFIHKIMSSKYDLIVINHTPRDWKHYGSKEYTDCCKLFVEQAQHMTALGTMLFKSTLILSLLKEIPLDMEKNYTLWQPIAFFDYFATHPFVAASYVDYVWTPLFSEETKGASFWHKFTLWQWGERWYKCIASLPSVYDPYKPQVLKFEVFDCKPFSIPFLLKVQKLGGLSPLTVYKNRKYLPYVCDVPMWQMYVLATTPRSWSRKLFKKSKNWKQSVG